MSEQDDAQKQQNVGEVYEAFFEMIDRSASRDAGIALFEQAMAEKEVELRTRWVGHTGVSFDAMREAQDELNKIWSYKGKLATVTGKISVDSSLVDIVPDSFQELRETDEGDMDDDYDLYDDGDVEYFVENARLRSHGIEVMPIFENEDDEGAISDIQIAYIFSSEDDEMQREIFTMRVGESYDHHYDEPTAAEAEVRLRAKWPEQMTLVDRLVRPDAKTALPGRLQLITRRLNADLNTSEELRSLLDIYVNGRIQFGTEPYMLTASTLIDCFDGESPDTDPNGDWMKIDLDGEVVMYAYSPKVHFSKKNNEPTVATFIAKTYNGEDGDAPEYIKVQANNVTGFRTTKAARSFLSRALMVGDMSVSDSDAYGSQTQPLPPTEGIEAIEGLSWTYDGKEVARPAFVDSLEKLENALETVIKRVKSSTSRRFTTKEEAEAVSVELLDKSVTSFLFGAGIANGDELEFSGESAIRLNVIANGVKSSQEPHVFNFAIDPDSPYVSQDPNDSFPGIVQAIVPSVKTISSPDDEVLGYEAMPMLVAHYYDRTQSAIVRDGLSLADINVVLRAQIPLDGSVSIKVVQLEKYRKQLAAMESAAVVYGKDHIMQNLYKLRAGLQNADSGVRSPYSGVSALKHLGEHFTRLDESGLGSTLALDVISSLLEGRSVTIAGNSLVRQEDGSYQYMVDEKFEGEVIDTRSDMVKGDIVLVLRISDQLVKYVPLSKIKSADL